MAGGTALAALACATGCDGACVVRCGATAYGHRVVARLKIGTLSTSWRLSVPFHQRRFLRLRGWCSALSEARSRVALDEALGRGAHRIVGRTRRLTLRFGSRGSERALTAYWKRSQAMCGVRCVRSGRRSARRRTTGQRLHHAGLAETISCTPFCLKKLADERPSTRSMRRRQERRRSRTCVNWISTPDAGLGVRVKRFNARLLLLIRLTSNTRLLSSLPVVPDETHRSRKAPRRGCETPLRRVLINAD